MPRPHTCSTHENVTAACCVEGTLFRWYANALDRQTEKDGASRSEGTTKDAHIGFRIGIARGLDRPALYINSRHRLQSDLRRIDVSSDTLRPGVLFDVDGTLCDTNYLHTLAWSRALRGTGEWAPMNAIHRLVGMGGDQLVPQLLGHDSPEAIAARPRRYQELAGDIRAFPRAADALRRVKSLGLAVVLATSAPDDELAMLRNVLKADDAIDGQTSANDITRSKPDPEIFLTAMRRYSIDPRRALVVGDSVWDVQAARAAGIGCLAVESGGFSQHELSEAGARHVYRDIGEIADQLLTSAVAGLRPNHNTT